MPTYGFGTTRSLAADGEDVTLRAYLTVNQVPPTQMLRPQCLAGCGLRCIAVVTAITHPRICSQRATKSMPGDKSAKKFQNHEMLRLARGKIWPESTLLMHQ